MEVDRVAAERDPQPSPAQASLLAKPCTLQVVSSAWRSAGRVVTLDALHTNHRTARCVVEDCAAHYVMTAVKDNCPNLLAWPGSTGNRCAPPSTAPRTRDTDESRIDSITCATSPTTKTAAGREPATCRETSPASRTSPSPSCVFKGASSTSPKPIGTTPAGPRMPCDTSSNHQNAHDLVLAYGTLGVLTSASLAVHAVGQGLAHARGTLSKHGVKQVDRLLSNTGIDLDEFFSYWVAHVVGAREEIMVALDWTSFARDGHDTLMLSMLTGHGRATALMWETVSSATLKDNQNRYEDELLYRFSKAVPEGVKVTVLAERGFADCNLFKNLEEELGFGYVIRLPASYYITSETGERRLASQWVGPNGRTRTLRDARVTEGMPAAGKQARTLPSLRCVVSGLVALQGVQCGHARIVFADALDQPVANVGPIQSRFRRRNDVFDVDDVLVAVEQKLQDDQIFGGEDRHARSQQADLARSPGCAGVKGDRVEKQVQTAAAMPEEQIAPGRDGRNRPTAVERDAARREGVKGFSRLVGIGEHVEVYVQGPPGLRVEAEGQGASDSVLDSRGAKEPGDLYRQLGWGQFLRCSRHRRFSRAQIRG